MTAEVGTDEAVICGRATMILELTRNRFLYLFQAADLTFTSLELLVAVRSHTPITQIERLVDGFDRNQRPGL